MAGGSEKPHDEDKTALIVGEGERKEGRKEGRGVPPQFFFSLRIIKTNGGDINLSHTATQQHREQGARLPEGSDWAAVDLLRGAPSGRPGGNAGFHGDGYDLHIKKAAVKRRREVSGVVVVPGKTSDARDLSVRD